MRCGMPDNDVLNNKTKMFESQHVYAARALSQILESIPIRYARTGNEYIFLLCLFLLRVRKHHFKSNSSVEAQSLRHSELPLWGRARRLHGRFHAHLARERELG